MSFIQIRNLNFSYPDSIIPLFDNFSLRIDTSWKLALVGDNGRGKTTLLKLLCGELKGGGSITANVRFRRFPFDIPDAGLTAYEIIFEVAPEADMWKIRRELNLIGLDEEVIYRPYNTLSGGEKTKFQLAVLFALDGFALIDEPTDHLDLQGRARLSQYLARKEGFIVVSHDRAFLDGCCNRVFALERSGEYLTHGNYSVYAGERKKREQAELTRKNSLESERSRLKAAAARTSDWADSAEAGKWRKEGRADNSTIDRGFVSARAAKMQKRASAVSARQTAAEEELKELLKNFEEVEELRLFPEKFFRSQLLNLSDITVKIQSKTIFNGLNFVLNEGERVAVTGGNGAGKSTLLKLICGEDIPFDGVKEVSPRLKISYVPQTAEYSGTLSDYSKEYSIDEGYFKAILAKFGFDNKDFARDMKLFSEGQKKKAALARSLCRRANLYVWDEPLNYLDVRSREQLERAVINSGASLLFVEHDAAFLTAVATRKLEL